MRSEPLYQVLASLVNARLTCINRGNDEWRDKHEATIKTLVNQYMPHGSGFDNGTTLDLDKSTGDKLVFSTAFHHMTEDGMYDGWTDHTITIKPSLAFKFHMVIGGRDRKQIKELIGQEFDHVLRLERQGHEGPFRDSLAAVTKAG